MAINNEGNPTIDPVAAMDGALLPFDRSYKGAGLSMVIEMLAGPLVNSAWIDNKTFTEEWGSLFIAIDPDLLVDVDVFKTNASELIAKVRQSRKGAGVTEIRLPGDSAKTKRKGAMASGFVDVEESILKELEYIR
jgi:LDH2 family malate/lactate/ureidoglycolate dehydrogenase